jgi:hypothetical protein
LIPEQQDIVRAVSGTALPGIGPISQTGVDLFPREQRLAPMDPFFTGAARGAIENLSGGMQDVFSPMFGMFETEIMPRVMGQFAGMDAAASGGAMRALTREGANLIGSQVAPLYMQSQMGLPGLAQQAGGFEQMARQQPLDVNRQMFLEERGLAGPYLDLGRSIIPSSNQFMENIASPGQQGFLQSAAPGLGMGLGYAMMMSDQRLKDDIEKITDALKKLERIEGKTFIFKNKPRRRRAGLIAQEVQAILPEAVFEDDWGNKKIDYSAVIGLLVNAIKELAEKVGD